MKFVHKKKKYEPPFPSTACEEEEKQYAKLKLRPFPSISRNTIIILGLLFLVLNSTHIFSFNVPETHAEDGAGSYWTCRWCGYSSNKCYEMSCSQCGRSR